MTSEPLVSVIMNCHNGATYLPEAIKSVINQTYANWELIFYDNDSVDNSCSIVKRFEDARIKYHKSSKYLCLGEARNQAIKYAKGEMIAFLDTDDLWLPEKLKKQIPLFDNLNIGIVICDTVFFKGDEILRQLYKKNKPKTGNVYRELLKSYFISLETAVIRKSALYTMPQWFDSRFEVIEEFDFFIRLSKEWELEYVDEVLAKWRMHDTSWTWTRPELFPAETKLFLDKIRTIEPKFSTSFFQEELAILISIVQQESLYYWMSGNGKHARNLLINQNRKKFSIKLSSIFFLTFMPYSTYKAVKNLYFKYLQ